MHVYAQEVQRRSALFILSAALQPVPARSPTLSLLSSTAARAVRSSSAPPGMNHAERDFAALCAGVPVAGVRVAHELLAALLAVPALRSR